MHLFRALVLIVSSAALWAQPLAPPSPITAANWGAVTTPVYGTSQAGTYGGAELFAGPNQFGFYYGAVLPNGRKVAPAGFASVQVGMNPIACALTPDVRFLVVANSSEKQPAYSSYINNLNKGGYSLTVIDNSSLTVISELNTSGSVYTGLIVTGTGPYTVYASGGAGNDVKIFDLALNGTLTASNPASIRILPMLPPASGSAWNYSPAESTALFAANGYLASGARATFPAGMHSVPMAASSTWPATPTTALP